ncbi:MAG: hypothetical protein E6727_16780, partial [Lachnospiraceae bacterium]|nr:hypothetical protein [Lachnospiraceae bacterium]MDU2034063.1 hypothetical protein [Lachnospiraceae bacterium]
LDNSIIPYPVRGYLFLDNKNAVFMRLVAFRKRLINLSIGGGKHRNKHGTCRLDIERKMPGSGSFI